MSSKIQDALLHACEKFLPAIVRMLLPSGINCRQFMELAKRAYVQVATEEHGMEGRPANISKTAIVTGLTRPDVRRIRQSLGKPAADSYRDSDRRRYDLSSLLLDWHSNATLCAADGTPLVLPISGEGATFEALVQRHFGSIPPTAVLRELIIAGAAEQTRDGKVRVLRNYYRPPGLSVDHAERVGGLLLDFISTVQFNLYVENEPDSRTEYRTAQSAIPVRHLRAFNLMLGDESQALCKRIDRWLDDKRRYETEPGEETTRIGFGIYQITDT